MKKGLEVFTVRLKALREEKGIKQVEMAVFLGCSMRNYQRIGLVKSKFPQRPS